MNYGETYKNIEYELETVKYDKSGVKSQSKIEEFK